MNQRIDKIKNIISQEDAQYIRKAQIEDYPRIAEIYVFNNRMEYFPIFHNVDFSFSKLQVLSYANELQNNENLSVYVYDDGVIKGFVIVDGEEIQKLYVEYFFQSQGIGSALLDYAVKVCNGKYLWVLQKNTRAISFYKRHGLINSGEKNKLYGPANQTEFIIKMILKDGKNDL